MAYLTSRTLASSVSTNDLIHIVKTGDTSQGNPDGSSYKATISQLINSLGITSVCGSMNAVKDFSEFKIELKTGDERSVLFGQYLDDFIPPTETGCLVGSFDAPSGTWTCPEDGYYDLTIYATISVSSNPFTAITSNNVFPPSPLPNIYGNPRGFVGLTAPPTEFLTGSTPYNLSNRFGRISIALLLNNGDYVVCGNEQIVHYDTSMVIITATYINRYLYSGSTLNSVILNRTSNDIYAKFGNSFHFNVRKYS